MTSFAVRRKAHLALGKKGEDFAADHLEQHGFTLFARNWRTNAGELDIVAWKDGSLHFVEVKTLHHKEGFRPAYNLSSTQRRRNFYAGKVYLKLMDSPGVTAHFDLFEIEYTARGRLYSCRCWNDYLPVLQLPSEDEAQSVIPEEPLPEKCSFWKKWWIKLNFLSCPVCGTGNGGGSGFFCSACRSQLKIFSGRRCPGCGGELDGILAMCSQCLAQGERPVWQGSVSVFEHIGLGRTLILNFKYNNFSELARPLGKMGAEAVLKAGFAPQIVTAVPMYRTRKFLRGYNQAELLGRYTAKYLQIPYCSALKRVKSTSRQASLGRTARLKNLKNAFTGMASEKIRGKRVLLVDDVFTTGSTLLAASKELQKAQPEAIYVLTMSRRKELFRKKNLKRQRKN